MKILIADKLSKVGIDWLGEQQDVEVAVRPGLAPSEMAKIVGGYDGMIIRSGAKITAEVLASPGNLKGIVRAGVGVDNVDVPVATHKGIIVMNTPGGNTLSTAELAMTLMMALSRKIAPANTSLRSGQWDRKAYQGTQLAGKTMGVVGLGRIGRAVAKRAAALEIRVLGYDPFFAGGCPEGVEEMLKDLNELCKRADYITMHVPKSPDTLGMIGAEQFAVMKPTVRLINAARGGIIDESQLLKALNEGRVSGAALDVYRAEPPELEVEKQLVEHPNVLAVPHLGASTAEAQEQVALDAARQLVDALRGGEVRNAINAPGFDKVLPEVLRPYTELAQRMGTILAGITPGALSKVEVIYRGSIADMNVAPITTYLLVGLLTPHMEAPVNVINAPVLAKQRGLEIEQITSAKVREFANLMEVAIHADQMKRMAVGTIFGNKFPRIIAIDGYRMEMKPEGHVAIIFNDDRPGVLGHYGTVFGNNKINIADLTFSRKMRSGLAVVGINLDEEPSDTVMDEIRGLEFVKAAYRLKLPGLPSEEQEE
ncbi:MAG: phosphoglycerate dehydrogenase [Phycisphaerae bacterium]|jgi:D-3-phosphoglycerate dehydrogenase|nr:phosphoglycerate dehydrogenase [Phycisphaerae bacterium]